MCWNMNGLRNNDDIRRRYVGLRCIVKSHRRSWQSPCRRVAGDANCHSFLQFVGVGLRYLYDGCNRGWNLLSRQRTTDCGVSTFTSWLRVTLCQKTVGEASLPGYGPLILSSRPVRTRMPGGVGAGGAPKEGSTNGYNRRTARRFDEKLHSASYWMA